MRLAGRNWSVAPGPRTVVLDYCGHRLFIASNHVRTIADALHVLADEMEAGR